MGCALPTSERERECSPTEHLPCAGRSAGCLIPSRSTYVLFPSPHDSPKRQVSLPHSLRKRKLRLRKFKQLAQWPQQEFKPKSICLEKAGSPPCMDSGGQAVCRAGPGAPCACISFSGLPLPPPFLSAVGKTTNTSHQPLSVSLRLLPAEDRAVFPKVCHRGYARWDFQREYFLLIVNR